MTPCSGIMENKMETTIMENQMEKKMENEMEYIGVIYYSSFHFLFHSPNIGVSLNYGYLFGGPHNEDYSILGSIGVPLF